MDNYHCLPASIPLDNNSFLHADIAIPQKPSAIVIFAHGSGSSRHSRRNRYVASALNQSGIITLLLDLLTEQEEIKDEETAEFRFNIALLADRLVAATDWLLPQFEFSQLRQG